MRDDDRSTTEAEAARAAAILGRSEWVGSDVGDQEPGPFDARGLGPDPWLPFNCPACNDVDERGMQEKCRACGWRNFGWGVSE